jgi:NADH dehydrogenase/NADH:ubiquinone oxidoreductase subunit G
MPVEFTINGMNVSAGKGESLIDVARRHGFEIPSLCHHEAVTPYGACRLCLVEITRKGRTKITTSCNYEVLPDIEVKLDTPEVIKHRKMVLELLLAEAPDAAPLRKVAQQHGVSETRLPITERNDCIRCGLCVRICSEIVGVNALGFHGRGDRKEVGPPYAEPSELCIGCAACVYACPCECIKMVQEGDMRHIVRWGRKLPMAKDEEGRPLAPNFQLRFFSELVGLPKDFYRKAPGSRD